MYCVSCMPNVPSKSINTHREAGTIMGMGKTRQSRRQLKALRTDGSLRPMSHMITAIKVRSIFCGALIDYRIVV